MIRGVPYDAEVEYLQTPTMSDREQYTTRIDTGISPTVDTEVFLDFVFIDRLAGDQVCAARTGTHFGNRFFVFSSDTGGRVVLGNWSITDLGLVGHRHTILFNEYQTHHYYIDGVDKGAMGYTQYSEGNGNHLLLFATTGYEPRYGTSNSRIYGCRIRVGGVLVRDFVPVRVGTVGYMFDRVSRRLFGNSGTGSFIIGPDVAKPVMGLHFYGMRRSAREYVQDGLAAMWDGIENAGWGVHDANTTTWKDLIGSADMSMNTSTYTDWGWTGNAVSIDESASSYYVAYTNNAALMGALNNASAFTIELFAVKDGTGTARRDQYLATSGNTILIQSYRTNSSISFYSNVNQNVVSASSISTLSPFLASCVQTPTSKRVYFDGVLATEALSEFGDVVWRDFMIASQGGAPRRIFCVRIYNRALSAEEVAHNYLVDRVRFNIPEVLS